MRIAFLMDELDTIAEPAMDTTLHIVRECVGRGHDTFILHARNLTVRSNQPQAFLQRIVSEAGEDVATFFAGLELRSGQEPVRSLDVLFHRADPPPDQRALGFLDLVRDDVLVLNGVDGLRRWSNKFYPLAFAAGPDDPIIPETHISKNRKYLRRILDESDHRYMVLKPLEGAGGHGVILLDREAERNLDSLLDFYIGRPSEGRSGSGQRYVVLQEYLPEAEHGDVRVLVLDGEPIGAMRRIPAPGQFRSNVHAGGRVAPWRITEEDRALVAKIKDRLAADGLFFVGLDLIGGRIVEINVVSPGGIPRINALDGVQIERLVVDAVERRLSERRGPARPHHSS